MLISETIEMYINNKNIKHYIDKGYTPILKQKITVLVTDLPKYSKALILAKCHLCERIVNITYHSYNDNFNKLQIYTCGNRECMNKKMKMSTFHKYGVENVININGAKEKRNKTNVEKYGDVSPAKTDAVKHKAKITNIEKYGVEYTMQNIDIRNKAIATNIEKYGFGCSLQNDEIKCKKVETVIKNYGVDNILKSSKIREIIKNTNIEKYGVEYPSQSDEIKDKIIKTNREKYGVDHSFQADEVKNKIKNTNVEKHGVEYPSQNTEIFNKIQKNGYMYGIYENIHYQGTYELDFVKFCKINNIYIENVKFKIEYFDNTTHFYHPDFFIKKLNLVIEIKSTYTYEMELEKNILKQEATIKSGYNFLFIIDKKYDEFLKFMESLN